MHEQMITRETIVCIGAEWQPGGSHIHMYSFDGYDVNAFVSLKGAYVVDRCKSACCKAQSSSPKTDVSVQHF